MIVDQSKVLSIWLATTGEPLESDGESVPLLQTGRLAKFLAERGHQVTWWTSRFNHRTKRARPTPPASGRLSIRLIDSPGYAKNVSLQRIWDHRVLARNFLERALMEARPDIMVAALPPVELANAAVRAGLYHGCPVIVDVRDQWPDLIVDHCAPVLRPFARLALSQMNNQARYALSRATAITGITDSYVAWGLEKAGRARRPLDGAFPIAREVFDIEWTEEGRDGLAELAAAGVVPNRPTMIASFVGSLGKQFDISTVIAAARELDLRRAPIRLVIAGGGERRQEYQTEAQGLKNLVFTGHLSRAGVGALLSASGVGIAPYLDIRNFRDNIPNKIVEYLSAGLPILSPLSGEVLKLLTDCGVGRQYVAGSPQSLAGTIETLREDPALRQQLSVNARKLFLERFEATGVHSRLTEHLERVARERRDTGFAA